MVKNVDVSAVFHITGLGKHWVSVLDTWHGLRGKKAGLLGKCPPSGMMAATWSPFPLSLGTPHPVCARLFLLCGLGGGDCVFPIQSLPHPRWISGWSWNFPLSPGPHHPRLQSLPTPSPHTLSCHLGASLLLCSMAKAPWLCQRRTNAWNSEDSLNIEEVPRNRA